MNILKDILQGCTIVTAAPNNGSTSFVQMLSNIICYNGGTILYYNPSRDLNREFIQEYYKHTYHYVCFIQSPLENLIEYITYIINKIKFDYIIIDPGDIIVANNQLILLKELLSQYNCNMICTSQIREDPNKGGQLYGTIDKLNKRYRQYGEELFKYSIWIRNVTELSIIFDNKYIEIYQYYRDKNNYIDRKIAKYSKEGHIVNEKDYY